MRTTPQKALVCSTAVVAAVSIALTMCVTISVAAAQEPDMAWRIGPRTLPPPDGASAKLRQMLADSPAPSGPAFPTDLDALKKLIAAGDAERAAKADALIQELKLDMKEQNMAGVRVYRLTPPQVAPEHANRLFVHIHGGAFIAGSGRSPRHNFP
jgi:monoterpene epsilon-lactone hydrolase